MHPENNGPLATSTSNTDWDAGAWDGMSEEEALEWDLIEVLSKLGTIIASQSWARGSWSTVYEYKGRYFAVDEVQGQVCSSAEEAFERASIGKDAYDEINKLYIMKGYERYLAEN